MGHVGRSTGALLPAAFAKSLCVVNAGLMEERFDVVVTSDDDDGGNDGDE